jgi:hypothetical protein
LGKWILNFVICEAFENSMSETKKKRPLHHRIAYSYFLKLQADKPFPEDAHHILNEQELAWMARVRRTAMLTAGAYGAFFVLVYYIPIYIWPEWWKTLVLPWELPLLGKFNWGKQVWSIILVLMELFFLTRLNILVRCRYRQCLWFSRPARPQLRPPCRATFYGGIGEQKQRNVAVWD